jgi:hypothetical protein
MANEIELPTLTRQSFADKCPEFKVGDRLTAATLNEIRAEIIRIGGLCDETTEAPDSAVSNAVRASQ